MAFRTTCVQVDRGIDSASLSDLRSGGALTDYSGSLTVYSAKMTAHKFQVVFPTKRGCSSEGLVRGQQRALGKKGIIPLDTAGDTAAPPKLQEASMISHTWSIGPRRCETRLCGGGGMLRLRGLNVRARMPCRSSPPPRPMLELLYSA